MWHFHSGAEIENGSLYGSKAGPKHRKYELALADSLILREAFRHNG